MHEEGRHILFFVNWVAWHRRNMPLVAPSLVRAEGARGVGVPGLGAHRHRVRRQPTASRTTTSPSTAPASSAATTSTSFKLMETCLAENDRRLGIYDTRLKRPRFVPFMIRTFRRFVGPKQPPPRLTWQ